tara:strand:- start:326 stop:673 length:348 start_codon:yes stop_codon:yes gene_type:complete
MAKKALILNNKVVDVCDATFEVHSGLTWMDCDDTVIVGYELVDGVLKDTTTVEPDKALNDLRMSRNRRLLASDWTQSRDVTLSNDADWKIYRQALRDLPANTSDPTNPTWPTKPS